MGGNLVGGHAPCSTDSTGMAIVAAEREDVASALRPAKSCGAIFHLARMLSKGKSLCAAQFGTLFELI